MPPASFLLEERLPTRGAVLLFRTKALLFQGRRWLVDAVGGPRRHRRSEALAAAPAGGSARGDLWHESSAPQERRLLLGKLQNLRVATQRLHGITIPAGETFSFWKQIGRTTARRGFAVGRELREGCLIPTVGGGLCQLSGAIYQAALEAGLEVVERHAHSNPGVSKSARLGRDATIFWNYVDLRLRATCAWRLEVVLTKEQLLVTIRSAETLVSGRAPTPIAPLLKSADAAPLPNSCATCGLDDCFRHQEEKVPMAEGVAWLVDDCWPEWARYLEQEAGPAALLCRPLDGRLFRKPIYHWPTAKFARVRHATWQALRRAWATRRLREQGAARQRALLVWDERLATAYQSFLTAEHTHLVVSQNLLPFLWRDGALGGRSFDVLMQRLPMHELQARLDLAAQLHPESHTCGDFRAPAWLVSAEQAALAAAHSWITPHRAVAKLAGTRAKLLPWSSPPAMPRPITGPQNRVVFPASTLCRKGAYELRKAARQLGLEVVCLGGILEGADFWTGVSLSTPAASWLEGAACVVLPAFVEHRPRRLLQALAAGVPVIATPDCGLAPHDLLIEVPAGDAQALIASLRQITFAAAPARSLAGSAPSRAPVPSAE